MSASFDARHHLAEALRERQGKLGAADKNQEAASLLGAHMLEISGNPNGSDPADYMGENDLRTLHEFVRVAHSLGWPGSEPIQMLEHRIPGRPAWKNQTRASRSSVDKALFYRPVRPPLRGYRFAKLRMPLGQDIAVAEDSKLYALRGTELTRSMGMGWGTLPDREYLDGVIPRGDPINYGAAVLLSKVLAGKIPRNSI